MTPRFYARPAGVLALLALAACATTGPLEPPRVTVTGVSLDYFTAADAKFTVQVKLANPNSREIAVDAIDAELRIEDVPIGTARLAAPVRLPARGETSASIVAGTDLFASLQASAQVARRLNADKASTVRYAVSGAAVVEGGVRIPFSRAGEFKLSVSAPAR